jgi:hypothetical protein
VRTVGRYAFTAALAVALQTHAAQTGAGSDDSTGSAGPGVGAQYDGTHAYVAPRSRRWGYHRQFRNPSLGL